MSLLTRSDAAMRPRSNLADLFSTFWQFGVQASGHWVSDRRLRHNIESSVRKVDDTRSPTFWVLHWYEAWQTQTDPLALPHLTAYVQESCYWSAQRLSRSLYSYPSSGQFSGQQSLSDLFQTAIAQVEKVLKGFNPDLSHNLRSYTECRFTSVIKNALRQQRAISFSTDWFLLHGTSKKRMVESLQQFGDSAITIQQYLLAWRCFQQLYLPQASQPAQKLVAPDADTWQAIATLYNAERLGQLGIESPIATPVLLEKWMLHCARAIRSWQFPTLVSVDAPLAGQESGSLLDNLSDEGEVAGVAELIVQEENQQRSSQQIQIAEVIRVAIADLDEAGRSLLQFYYRDELTQQQIAQLLNLKQYAVSRQLSRVRQKLVLALVTWSQETLHISLTPGVLETISDVLDEWLKHQYYSEHQRSASTASS